MASAAPAQTKCAVNECIPSGIGFTAVFTMIAPPSVNVRIGRKAIALHYLVERACAKSTYRGADLCSSSAESVHERAACQIGDSARHRASTIRQRLQTAVRVAGGRKRRVVVALQKDTRVYALQSRRLGTDGNFNSTLGGG